MPDVSDQATARSRRIEEIDARLAEIRSGQWQLANEQWRLEHERTTLVQATSGRRRSGAGPYEWRPERVRDVLLWLGVVLLALAAMTFTAVAWARLGDGGRAGLLLSATVLVAAATGTTRRRLPATAEALAGLTIALLLVDCYATRRAGLGENVSVEVWAALALGVSAVVCLALGIAWTMRVGRVSAVVLAQVSAGLLIHQLPGNVWAEGVGAAFVAVPVTAGAVVLWKQSHWRSSAALLGAGAVAFELYALVTVLASIVNFVDDFGGSDQVVGASGGMAAMGLTPAVAAWLGRERWRGGWLFDVLVGLSTAAVLGAGLALTTPVGPDPRWTIAAALGLGAIAAARLLNPGLSRGIAGAGGFLGASAVLSQIGALSLALLGPLAWASDAWSGDLGRRAADHVGPDVAFASGYAALMVPVLVGMAAAVAAAPLRRAPGLIPEGAARMAGVVLGVLATACAPLVAGVSIGTTIDVEVTAATALLAVGLVAERRQRDWANPCLVGAALLAVPATGWALVTRPLTTVFLAGVVVTVGTASFIARSPRVRATTAVIASSAALTRIALAIAHDADDLGPAGVVVALTGGLFLLTGVLGRRATPEGAALEVTGLLGLLAGAFLGSTSLTWLAGTLTVAVPVLTLAAFRRDRRAYGWVAVAATVAATWAWLAVAGVELVEAYTLPAAAAALGAGAVRRRLVPRTSSWVAYGAALTALLGPSTVLAVGEGGVMRPLALTAAGVLVVVLGARSRLQAPLALGGAALVALAVDILGPAAARVPRWTALGIAGLLLLWLGSTAERRLAEVRRLRTVVDQLA